MSIFFFLLRYLLVLSLAASCRSDEEARGIVVMDEIIERSKKSDLDKKKIIKLKGNIARLESHLDSVSKDAELYQKKSQELYQKTRGLSQKIEQRERAVKGYRREISQLRTDKQINEKKIAELDVELDEVSADRARLKGLNENLQKKIIYAQEVLDEVIKVQNSVRLIVGTHKRLKKEGFLEMGRRWKILGKRYKLSGKPKRDDPRAKLVSINQQLHLTLHEIPKALVDRSGKLELEALVGRSGKLKKDRDYKISNSGGTTIITFINDLLVGEEVLAVVKVKN